MANTNTDQVGRGETLLSADLVVKERCLQLQGAARAGYFNPQSHSHQLFSVAVVKSKVRRKVRPFKDLLEMGKDLFSGFFT